jgi:glycosyltransferase involved in cell wall biosynthesis
MEIDVIVPVRNGSQFITDCLSSIVVQSNLGDIIVVNDGSTDDTLSKVEEFAQKYMNIRIYSTGPRGLSQARNFGANHAKSKYIAFLDSDDTWEPHKLALHVAHIEMHPDCEFSFSLATEFTREYEKTPQPIELKDHPIFEDLLLQNYRITGSASSVIVKRQIFEELSGFDEKLRYGEDFDLWSRFAFRSMPCLIPEYLTNIRIHSQSMQRVQRVGEDRFLASQTFCNVWAKHPEIMNASQFRGRASEILWADFRKNFNVGMLVKREYDTYLKSNYKSVVQALGLESSSNYALSLFIRRFSQKFFYHSMIRRRNE